MWTSDFILLHVHRCTRGDVWSTGGQADISFHPSVVLATGVVTSERMFQFGPYRSARAPSGGSVVPRRLPPGDRRDLRRARPGPLTSFGFWGAIVNILFYGCIFYGYFMDILYYVILWMHIFFIQTFVDRRPSRASGVVSGRPGQPGDPPSPGMATLPSPCTVIPDPDRAPATRLLFCLPTGHRAVPIPARKMRALRHTDLVI